MLQEERASLDSQDNGFQLMRMVYKRIDDIPSTFLPMNVLSKELSRLSSSIPLLATDLERVQSESLSALKQTRGYV